MTVIGAEVIVESLRREGVSHVFGLPGTTVMSVIDALARQDELRYLSTRHEQVAAFMADGFARASGRPAVALASRGPGAANMAIAVHNAHAESIPLIALVGQVSSDVVHRDAFEETDLVSMFAPITKWAVEIPRADRIAELLQRAVRTATSGRPGPVMVSVPMDLHTEDVTGEFQPKFRPSLPWPDGDALNEAATLLMKSTAPVIIVGGGLRPGPSHDDVLRLAESLHAPVVTTWMRKNAIDNAAQCFVGPLGYGAPECAEAAVAQADVVLALGVRFSEFTSRRYTLLGRRNRLLHVDIDPTVLGQVYVPHLGIVADAAKTVHMLADLLDACPGSVERSRRRRELRGAYEDSATLPDETSEAAPVPSAAVVHALRAVVARDDVTLVQDVHTFGPWIARYVPFTRPRSYFAAAGGSMGWGFPAALGVALARPHERVVAVHGDGSFFMVCQDLETAVREQIPVVNLVINNFSYGNTRDRQRFAHAARYKGVFHDNPDFAAFARGLGAYGERVETADDLQPAILRALESGRPAVVDVIQGPHEGLPPGLVPPSSGKR